ncbi:MAG: hypothetical protein GXP29_12070 [Planctomycetes bacterium]|nr:hypothetical protein [Planctomycetota bacterium]
MDRYPLSWCALLVVALLLPACDLTIQPNPDDGLGSLPLPDNPEPIADTVNLRLVNLTSSALQAQIFIGSNGSTATLEELFVPANLFTEKIGLAASGLLAPASSDTALIDCFDDLVIGTDGGRFLDVETGQELGMGDPRLLQRGFVFDCDDEITLIYRFTGGRYQVDVTLE